jgi:hypothetical protein
MILYLGDESEKFAKSIIDQHADAILCTDDNIDDVINNKFLYTSICDVNRVNFSRLCLAAEKVNLYEDWSDIDLKKETNTIFGLWSNPSIEKETTNFYNLFFNDIGNSTVDAITNACKLVDQRKTDDKQIWAVGCSYTSSIGVEDHERWAIKLAEKMNKPVSILALHGSNITWAADQLLRSDIRSGDTVFWLLTGVCRIDYFSESDRSVRIYPTIKDWEQEQVDYLGNYEYSMLMKLLTHKWNVYMSIKSISQVINYCKQLNVDLYFGQGIRNDPTTDNVLIKILKQYPNFILPFSVELYYDNFMLDIGTDDCHPGPKTHIKIAEDFYKYVLRNQKTI